MSVNSTCDDHRVHLLDIREKTLELDQKVLAFETEMQKFGVERERFEAKKERFKAEKERFEAEKERFEAEKERFEAEKERFEAEKERFEAEKGEERAKFCVERGQVGIERGQLVVERGKFEQEKLAVDNAQKAREDAFQLEKRAFELEMKQQKDEIEQRLKGLQEEVLGSLFSPPQPTNDAFISSLPNVPVAHKDTIDTNAYANVDNGLQAGLLEQLALKTRQLKTISQLAQNRYDDAIRSEQRALQMRRDASQLQHDYQTKLNEHNEDKKKLDQLAQQNSQLDRKLRLQQVLFGDRSLNAKSDSVQLTKKQIGTEIQSLFGLTNRQRDTAVPHFVSGGVVSNGNTNPLDVQQKYPPERLDLCRTFKLSPENALALIEMSDEEYQSETTQKKLKICKALVFEMKSNPSKLSLVVLCNTIFAMSPTELAPFQLESMSTSKHFSDIATTLAVNLEGWGKEEAFTSVEYHFPQLNKQNQSGYKNYTPLLPLLYESTPSVSVPSQRVHPLDPTISSTLDDHNRILSGYLKSLLDDGTIPPLTPDLKLFFSTQHVANGEWIQFHGPGTLLFDHYAKYPLTLSSLCPKGKEGSFTSDDWYQAYYQTIVSKHGRQTSEYRISIKWEAK